MNREKLIEVGINYDEGVNRFSQNALIYEMFLLKFFKENRMETLGRQLREKDINGAYQSAHDLKGNAGNLSINNYYEKISELSAKLKKDGSLQECMYIFMQAQELYQDAEAAVKE